MGLNIPGNNGRWAARVGSSLQLQNFAGKLLKPKPGLYLRGNLSSAAALGGSSVSAVACC